MAILQSSGINGFFCSVKATGKQVINKAGNRVNEYVEHFITGFSGHGWKIWEYVKGKWMFETDAIRVRGQFTVFELMISKIRAIIGAQAITQGCGKVKEASLSDDGTAYLITLEEKDMSFVEYDFIRCQEFSGGQKGYHVEVESVSGGVIRVPVSEFELDAEGIALNPPSAGDDVVQFGNSSYDQKYKGRHSAIYMHTDESGQPAIDVMFDIYSKSWDGCTKVRVGGDIPGTEGLKGFYCENGMIKCVDAKGSLIYQLHPDGSFNLGKGQLKYDPKSNKLVFGSGVVLTWDNLSPEVRDNLKGEKGSDAEIPQWAKEWDTDKTLIGDKYVVSPHMFSGVKNEDGTLTGIIQGKECITIDGVKRSGLFSIKEDKVSFALNEDGTIAMEDDNVIINAKERVPSILEAVKRFDLGSIPVSFPTGTNGSIRFFIDGNNSRTETVSNMILVSPQSIVRFAFYNHIEIQGSGTKEAIVTASYSNGLEIIPYQVSENGDVYEYEMVCPKLGQVTVSLTIKVTTKNGQDGGGHIQLSSASVSATLNGLSSFDSDKKYVGTGTMAMMKNEVVTVIGNDGIMAAKNENFFFSLSAEGGFKIRMGLHTFTANEKGINWN